MRWTAMLSLRQSQEFDKHRLEVRQQSKWMPPLASELQAAEQAMEMVDRWNRIFLRNLRALRDLRRYAPAVNIVNAGQVNIGDQQVNVANSAVAPPPAP